MLSLFNTNTKYMYMKREREADRRTGAEIKRDGARELQMDIDIYRDNQRKKNDLFCRLRLLFKIAMLVKLFSRWPKLK